MLQKSLDIFDNPVTLAIRGVFKEKGWGVRKDEFSGFQDIEAAAKTSDNGLI